MPFFLSKKVVIKNKPTYTVIKVNCLQKMINFCIVIARGKVMKASQNNHKQNLAQPLPQTKQTEVLANANSCPNNANSTKGEQSLQNSSLQMSESVVQNAFNGEKNEKNL